MSTAEIRATNSIRTQLGREQIFIQGQKGYLKVD